MPEPDPVPASLVTPDTVKTTAGTFVFTDGLPTPETAAAVYGRLDRLHAVEAYRAGLPAVSLWAMRRAMLAAGVADGDVLVFSELMDCRSLFLTANADTVYFLTFLDLGEGPVVVDVPPDCLTVADDMWFRWVTDLGPPGPDRGEGGRYLFAGPGYQGPLPEGGMFVHRVRTNRVWLLGRCFLEDDNPAPAARRIREQLKITPYTPGGYGTSVGSFLLGRSPLAQPAEPRTPRFVEGSGLAINTVAPVDASFFTLLDEAVQAEPATALDPGAAAPIAAIGIVKDEPFAPDGYWQEVLEDAAATANAYVRAVAMRPRAAEGSDLYPGTGSRWTSPPSGGGFDFRTPPPPVTPEGRGPFPDHGAGRLTARASFFYLATGVTPAMCMNLPRIGSQYLWSTMDSTGLPLEGDRTYRLILPPGIPAEKFWSITLYDNQTRSMLATDQRFPRAGSQAYPTPAAVPDKDGSVSLWFDPVLPDGVPEGNWVQTAPGRNWFALLRLYSPLPAFFDRSWRPGEIELQAPATA
ncbi:DUF1254 domain-containing protein [Kitasatospora sp. CM 4170]|uniref:DUF1254 domain-containing protein n=1 Tax=Kitasatospora aburaviensis TaxID=67265 RepID=A0ABW1F868_9ACTN|nr:DUF1254 domain-containing protein [Kitasatospora sp. CM 4170]WNM43215.1 DUF1254 domain-containing protein [Kitasatospora sp. CM 4170]